MVLTWTFRGPGKYHSLEYDEAFCLKDKLRGQESTEPTLTKAPFCGRGETPTPKESMILDVQVNTSKEVKFTIACQMLALPPLSITKALIQSWPTEDLSLGHLGAQVYFPSVQKHSWWGQTKDWEWEGITGIACRKNRDEGGGARHSIRSMYARWMVGG